MNTERARVALVTGASRNIGRAIAIAIAIALARDGIDVAVHAANNRVAVEETARLVRANGRRAVVVTGDLTEPRTVSELVAQVAGEMGALDVLVHNAATRPETTIDDLAYAEWRHVMGVSLDAMFLLAQAALPHLRAGVDPAVVALGGMSAHTGARNRPHVVAAKAGLVGLVRALAHDLAPNVTANIVVPGLIDTVRDGAAPHHHGSRTNLAGRCGRPEEVADAVAYLASTKARYVTGQTLHLNGGAFLP